MTVFFRKARARWAYDFEYRGTRYSGYATVAAEANRPAVNRTEALMCERLARAAVIRAAGAAAITPSHMSLAEAFAAYAARNKGKSNFGNIRNYVRELIGFFGATTPVPEIGEEWIWKYIAWAREQPLMIYVGGPKKRADADDPKNWRPAQDGRKRTDSTINHYLTCLRTSLNIAARARDPATGESRLPHPPTVPELKVPKRLPRPVQDADIRNGLAVTLPHIAEAMVLTVLMGFRQGEVFALRRPQLDRQLRGIWLAGEDTKGQRDEFVPASGPAMELLERLDAQAAERGTEFLITWRRSEATGWQPIKSPKSAWRRIKRETGIKNRWHDLKASFVTAIAQKNSAAVTQGLARHKDAATTALYIALVDDTRRAAVDSIADRSAIAGIDMSARLGRVPTKNPIQLGTAKRRGK